MAREFITPEIAKAMLDNNPSNRPLSESRVAQMCGAVARGEWQYNGDTLKIATGGGLLDGQHRLAMVIDTGVGRDFEVIRELDPACFITMDRNKPRSPADFLGIMHVPNRTAVAAAARMLMQKERGVNMTDGGGRWAPSPEQVVAFVKAEPDLVPFVTRLQVARQVVESRLLATALYRQRFHPRIDAFIAGVASGQDLGYGDPRLRLRDRRSADRAKNVRDPALILALTEKAWAAFRDGRTLGVLKV